MSLAKLPSAVVDGIRASGVRVEVDVATGLPGFTVVGLADKAVEESRERVRSALKHSGFSFPLSRITVHLAPSEKKKSGVHFDVPIALGILLADNQIKKATLPAKTLFLGGLSLDGTLQAITGALVLVEWAKGLGFETVVLPSQNYHEARLIKGIKLIPVKTLTDILSFINQDYRVPRIEETAPSKNDDDIDWVQIQGQTRAKRAAVVAAAGGHNLLLEGPPGAGKTLLARGLRSILPELNDSERIEVVKIHSVAGQLRDSGSVAALKRPFRNPHHSASHIAVVGGGPNPRPGEISLSHRGVLFLDELPEFNRLVLESLRQPLEDGEVHVARAAQTAYFPADFILVGTMNPCPCGWFGSNQKECVCTPYAIAQYRKKISGPILDRIDLYLQLPSVSFQELRSQNHDFDELQRIRTAIREARNRAVLRNKGRANARIPAASMNEWCVLTTQAEKLLEEASSKFIITGRGYHKILKVARTIADLANHDRIEAADVAEALQYRFTSEEG